MHPREPVVKIILARWLMATGMEQRDQIPAKIHAPFFAPKDRNVKLQPFKSDKNEFIFTMHCRFHPLKMIEKAIFAFSNSMQLF